MSALERVNCAHFLCEATIGHHLQTRAFFYSDHLNLGRSFDNMSVQANILTKKKKKDGQNDKQNQRSGV